MKNLLSVRFEAINEEKFVAEVNHSLRLHSKKSTNNQENSNPNYFYNEDSQEWEKYTNKNLSKFGSQLKKDYETKVVEHKKVHNENRKINKSGFKKFDKSYSMFVFTFSEKMKVDLIKYQEENNQQKINEILNAGKNTANKIAKHFGNEILYLTLHLDEKGNPHFQGMATNFNKENGKKLNIQTNKKNGEICQDILAEYFEPLGHSRGVSKDISGAKHLSTAAYKISQDLKKDNQELENVKQKIIQDLMELSEETEAKQFLKLFTRYVKSEAKPRLKKLINKYEKSVIKKQKERLSEVQQSTKELLEKDQKTKTKKGNKNGTITK